MVHYIYWNWKNELYRFPVATNLINGKLIHDLAIKYELFPVNEYHNLWLGDGINTYHVTNTNMMYINEDGSMTLFGDKWASTFSNEIDKYLPTLETVIVKDPVFSFT